MGSNLCVIERFQLKIGEAEAIIEFRTIQT